MIFPLRIGIIKSRFHYSRHQILDFSWFHDFPSPGAPYLWLLLYKNTSNFIRKYMETSLNNIIFSYFNFLELQKFVKFGPTKHIFVLIFFWNPPPQKDWSILSFLKDIFHDTFRKILRDHLFWQNAKSQANHNESNIFFKEWPIIWPRI